MTVNKLREGLNTWLATEKYLHYDAVTRLLSVLCNDFPSLPKSAKTLISQTDKIVPIHNGEYDHLKNWREGIIMLINTQFKIGMPKLVNLCVNIDGIPLYSNTVKYTAYPILVKLLEFPQK